MRTAVAPCSRSKGHYRLRVWARQAIARPGALTRAQGGVGWARRAAQPTGKSTSCPSGFSPLLGGSSSSRTGFGRSRPTTRGRSRRPRPDSWPPPATPKQHGAPRGTRAQRGGATLRGVRRGTVARRLGGSPDLHPLRRVQRLRQRSRTKGEAPAGTARPQPPRATRRLRGGVRPTIQRRRPAGRADYNPRRGPTSSA